MKALVLAGGEGTRMRPYTRVLPKPLLPVGDRPILEIIVEQLRESGIDEIVLATGYLSGLIEAFFGDGGDHGVPIRYAREHTPLGTAGPMANVEGLDETFLMMNGDVLTSLSYRELVEAHAAAGAAATIATRRQQVGIDYGVMQVSDGDGQVRSVHGIEEKPSYTLQVSMGVYVFEPRVVEHIEPGRRDDFPDLLRRLLAAGERVNSYEHDGFWIDLGQVDRLEDAVQRFDESAEEFTVGSRRRQLRPVPLRPADRPARDPAVERVAT